MQTLTTKTIRTSPGRLSEHIELLPPVVPHDCAEIWNVHTRKFPLGNDVDVAHISNRLLQEQERREQLHRAAGCGIEYGGRITGADIEGICREACLVALKRGLPAVTNNGRIHCEKSPICDTNDDVKITIDDFEYCIQQWKELHWF